METHKAFTQNIMGGGMSIFKNSSSFLNILSPRVYLLPWLVTNARQAFGKYEMGENITVCFFDTGGEKFDSFQRQGKKFQRD